MHDAAASSSEHGTDSRTSTTAAHQVASCNRTDLLCGHPHAIIVCIVHMSLMANMLLAAAFGPI